MNTESGEPGGSLSLQDIRRELDRQVQQAVAEMRSQAELRFPLAARLWMAVAPGWTVPLAERCKFPGLDYSTPASLFDEMQQAGLVEVYASLAAGVDGKPLRYYRMSEAAQAEILQSFLTGEYSESGARAARLSSVSWREDHELGLPSGSWGALGLVKTAAEVAGRMIGSSIGLEKTAPEITRWAELAQFAYRSDASPGFVAQEELIRSFQARVDEAFQAALKAPDATPQAGAIQGWINVARPLAVLLEYAQDGRLSRAIAQAGRRIELLQRRQYETRHLESFFRREKQIEAVRDLLAGPDHLWALHLIGPGGVGKSMLIRYLYCSLNLASNELCLDEAFAPFRETITARIDFDYISPNYPRLDPGLLLSAFSEELRLQDIDLVASRFFDRAEQAFNRLSSRLSDPSWPSQDPAYSPTTEPEFIEGVVQFLEGLRQFRRPVLLILDTCEELEKASPTSHPDLNITETFRILRALHDGPHTLVQPEDGEESSHRPPPDRSSGLPGLRVLFSGRRLLAGRGHQDDGEYLWEVEGQQPGQDADASTPRLPARGFLRLYQLRGFEHAEAHQYMEQENVLPDLIAPVIQRSSPDAGSGITIRWSNQAVGPDDGKSEAPDEGRCNPYQLRLYMDWAKEDPPPSPQEILNAVSGRYVELRILNRLHDDMVKPLLPLITLLGHFDQRLLGSASGLDEKTAQEAFRRVLMQEWVSQHRSGFRGADRAEDGPPEGETRFIADVHKHVRDRMYTYFDSHGRLPDLTARKAALAVMKFTLRQDLHRLDWTDLDAGLRLLQADLEVGARWWEKIEARLMAAPDLAGSLRWVELLAGKDGSAGPREPNAGPDVPPENRLRPFILATQAALHLHLNHPERLPGLWQEAAQKAAAHPNSAACRKLYRRAAAGQISVQPFSGIAPASNVEFAKFWQAWSSAIEQETIHSQEAASWAAALEALVELGETPWRPTANDIASYLFPGVDAPRLAGLLVRNRDQWLDEPGVDEHDIDSLVAFIHTMAGRAAVLQSDQQTAARSFELALAQLSAQKPARQRGAARSPWHDWILPEHLPARVGLDFLRLSSPGWLSPEDALDAAEENLGSAFPEDHDPESLDLDRFSAARLRLALAAESPLGASEQTLEKPILAQARERMQGLALPPRAIAHRQTPPYIVFSIEIASAYGLPGEALELLNTAEEYAAVRPEVRRSHLKRLRRQLVLRWHLDEEQLLSIDPGLEGASIDTAQDWLEYYLLNNLHQSREIIKGHDPQNLQAPIQHRQLLHIALQAGTALTPAAAQEAISFAIEYFFAELEKDPTDSLPALSAPPQLDLTPPLILDLFEAVIMDQAMDEGLLAVPELKLWLTGFSPANWVEQNDRFPEESARLLLRSRVIVPELLRILVSAASVDRSLLDKAVDFLNSVDPHVSAEDVDKFTRSIQNQEDPRMIVSLISGSKIADQLDTLKTRLGTRRLGLIALQEGELLARRLPAQASDLLEQAAAWLEESGSYTEAWMACLLHMMALVRLDFPEVPLNLTGFDYSERAAQVASFESLVNRQRTNFEKIPGLADRWQDLSELAAAKGDPDKLGPPEARPWLLRQAFCLAALESAQSGFGQIPPQPLFVNWAAPGIVRILSWVRENYSRQVDGKTVLPVEWSNWPQNQVQDVQVQGTSTSSISKDAAGGDIQIEQQQGCLPALGQIFSSLGKLFMYLVIFVLILGSLLALTFFAFRWLAGNLFDIASLTLTQQVLVFAVSLIVLYFLARSTPKVRASWRSIWAALGARTLYIQPAPEKSPGSIQARAKGSASGLTGSRTGRDAVVRLRSEKAHPALNTWRLHRLETVTGPDLRTTLPPVTAPYQELAERLPGDIQKDVQDLAGRLGRRTMPVELHIESSLHDYCWEAAVLLNARGEGVEKPSTIPLLPLRLIPSSRSTPLRETLRTGRSRTAAVLSLVGSTRAERAVRAGWLEYAKPGDIEIVELEAVGEAIKMKASSTYRVAVSSRGRLAWASLDPDTLFRRGFQAQVELLHAVGLVENVQGELRLFLEQEQEYGSQLSKSRQAGRDLAQERSSLSVFQLLSRFPDLAMCVLQGFPEEREERFEGDRRDAALLRMFAAQMALQGVAVLVIPPVKTAVVKSILSHVSRAAAKATRANDRAFYSAIRRIQDELHQLYPNEWEQALDVCLFLPQAPQIRGKRV
jgi:hypothetical protein